MALRSWLPAFLWVMVTGCANLIIQDTDNGLEKTAKIAARVIMAVPTIGISEGAIADIKELRRFEEWRGRPSHAASDEEWRSYWEDQQLADLADSFPLWLVSFLSGDVFTAPTEAVGWLAGLYGSHPAPNGAPAYLPVPKRGLYPPSDRCIGRPC